MSRRSGRIEAEMRSRQAAWLGSPGEVSVSGHGCTLPVPSTAPHQLQSSSEFVSKNSNSSRTSRTLQDRSKAANSKFNRGPSGSSGKSGNKEGNTGGSNSSSALCPLCLRPYEAGVSPPMLLVPCGHSACRPCVERLQPHGGQCPSCYEAVQTAMPNHALAAMLQDRQSTPAPTRGRSHEHEQQPAADSHHQRKQQHATPPPPPPPALDDFIPDMGWKQTAGASASVNVGGDQGGLGGGGVRTSMSSDDSMLQEGPLPPDLLFHLRTSSHSAETKNQVEVYLRRLLARQRRLRIYHEELSTAQAEDADIDTCLKQSQLVSNALEGEVSELDRKIALLQQERNICQQQLEQASSQQEEWKGKQRTSASRSLALNSAIENLRCEIGRSLMIVHQLMPTLETEPALQMPTAPTFVR